LPPGRRLSTLLPAPRLDVSLGTATECRGCWRGSQKVSIDPWSVARVLARFAKSLNRSMNGSWNRSGTSSRTHVHMQVSYSPRECETRHTRGHVSLVSRANRAHDRAAGSHSRDNTQQKWQIKKKKGKTSVLSHHKKGWSNVLENVRASPSAPRAGAPRGQKELRTVHSGPRLPRRCTTL
jgi:hypothetical protein